MYLTVLKSLRGAREPRYLKNPKGPSGVSVDDGSLPSSRCVASGSGSVAGSKASILRGVSTHTFRTV